MMEYQDFRPQFLLEIMSKNLVRLLGEYCNRNIHDRMAYSLYLLMAKIVYRI